MAKMVKTSDLQPHPRLGDASVLPPLTDAEYTALRQSIEEAKRVVQPLLVAWPERIILDGHHRWRAAQELGIEKVPIITEECTDEAVQFRLGIQLNLDRRQVDAECKSAVARLLLKEDPQLSDRAIAGTAGISHPTVAKIRLELETSGEVERFTTRLGQNGVSQAISRSGRKSAPRANPIQPTWPEIKQYIVSKFTPPPPSKPDELRRIMQEAGEVADLPWLRSLRRLCDFLEVAASEPDKT